MEFEDVKFLVVEDNDLDVERIERCFARAGVENALFRARDGMEALNIMHGRKGLQKLERPYVVFLDLNMPRMNGLEFLQLTRMDEEISDIPVYVLTTSDHSHDLQAAGRYGVQEYFVKPFSQGHLEEAIRTVKLHWAASDMQGMA